MELEKIPVPYPVKRPVPFQSSTVHHFGWWTPAAILDLKVTYILNFHFYRSIVILTHENIGLDTKIESLTCILLVLWHIYRFWVMAAGGRVPPGAGTMDIWCTGVVPILFFVHTVRKSGYSSMRTQTWRSYDLFSLHFLIFDSRHTFLPLAIKIHRGWRLMQGAPRDTKTPLGDTMGGG